MATPGETGMPMRRRSDLILSRGRFGSDGAGVSAVAGAAGAGADGSASGGVNFTLHPKVGLDAAANTPVPFDEFFQNLCFDLTADLGFFIKAEVLGFEVWSLTPEPFHFDLANNCQNDPNVIKAYLGERRR